MKISFFSKIHFYGAWLLIAGLSSSLFSSLSEEVGKLQGSLTQLTGQFEKLSSCLSSIKVGFGKEKEADLKAKRIEEMKKRIEERKKEFARKFDIAKKEREDLLERERIEEGQQHKKIEEFEKRRLEEAKKKEKALLGIELKFETEDFQTKKRRFEKSNDPLFFEIYADFLKKLKAWSFPERTLYWHSERRSSITFFDNFFRKLDAKKNDPYFLWRLKECRATRCCLTRGVYRPESDEMFWYSRELFENKLAHDIDGIFSDKNKFLIYTDFASGGLKQAFLNVLKLKKKGFRKFALNFVDIAYESLMKRLGSKREPGVSFIKISKDDKEKDDVLWACYAFAEWFTREKGDEIRIFLWKSSEDYIRACKKDKCFKSDIFTLVDFGLDKSEVVKYVFPTLEASLNEHGWFYFFRKERSWFSADKKYAEQEPVLYTGKVSRDRIEKHKVRAIWGDDLLLGFQLQEDSYENFDILKKDFKLRIEKEKKKYGN